MTPFTFTIWSVRPKTPRGSTVRPSRLSATARSPVRKRTMGMRVRLKAVTTSSLFPVRHGP